MREIRQNIDDAKKQVKSLEGKEIEFIVNKGRNKLYRFIGKIENAYSSIFTVSENSKLYSYSYNDILTRNIKFIRALNSASEKTVELAKKSLEDN